MKLLIINGPNLNMLGIREPGLYGHDTYESLIDMCKKEAESMNIDLECFQSNHEGDIVDRIQQAYQNHDGIIINPGGYSHTSVAILDALKAVGIPTIEVHITNPDERETFRQLDYISYYSYARIVGKGLKGYIEAMHKLFEDINNR